MKKPLSLYIHIPFCVKKCLYCDFPSFAQKDELYLPYTQALLKEIASFKDTAKDYEIQTIFIGGGTPTVLPFSAMEKIISYLYQNFSVSPKAEFTIETNPGTLSFSYAKDLRKIGLNRISMGLQAWQDTLLQKLGRIHTQKDFVKTYDDARKAGFSNINIDIMSSLPWQTLKDWQETLFHVTALEPEHISSYSLIVEENTPFWHLYEKGTYTYTEETLDREMYDFCQDALFKKGYSQYEISNFSKKGRQCRHNIVYWRAEEYLGLGLGAHSFFQKKRFHNPYDLKKYIQSPKTLFSMAEEIQTLTEKEQMEEFMFLGLRMTKGIEKKRFQNRFQKELDTVYGSVIKKLVSQGLLEETTDTIFLTKRGMDISNTVFTDFLLDKD